MPVSVVKILSACDRVLPCLEVPGYGYKAQQEDEEKMWALAVPVRIAFRLPRRDAIPASLPGSNRLGAERAEVFPGQETLWKPSGFESSGALHRAHELDMCYSEFSSSRLHEYKSCSQSM